MLVFWFLLIVPNSESTPIQKGQSDPQSDPLATRFGYNLWMHLAGLTNVTTFCLSQHIDAQLLFSTCLIPVCRAPVHILKDTRYTTVFDKSDITYQSMYGWGKPTYQLPPDAASFYTPQVANHKNNTCVRMTGCSEQKPSTGCLDPGKPLWNCTHAEQVLSSRAHVPLPPGWFFTCGQRTYSYIPGDLIDTTCCISRLTVYLPQKHELQKAHKRRRSTITENCDSNINLWSKAEYISLAVSLIGVPGLAAGNTRQLRKVAGSLAKTINATSTAISALNQEQQQLRHAVLDNRSAIDYLLLVHHQGCEAVEQMCCFNLTGQSQVVGQQIKQLHNLVTHITEDENPGWWDKLWSWLPNVGWFKGVFGIVMILMLLCLFLPCFLPIIPNVQNMIQKATQHRAQHIMALYTMLPPENEPKELTSKVLERGMKG
uniref:Envelope protein Mab4 n=1 Tax=Mabuya sp. NRPS-2014 TaxID=1496371 RepID=A0A2H4RC10_9SAUR|nr:envelope protein Mab4 [Mabuya sp. NRPS-2014]